ncbi:MAG: glycoside hydrolase family 3 C-terminal domain-containing protein [Spirochaetales bacterium]|nr:glycoside hydrolase family 3 C-terminal domain-containing protein [Spirochaetales bacterium]
MYSDHTKSFEQRVADLISRLTLPEKVSQLIFINKAIPRLGIPEYVWCNECLHGVARAGNATVFPQAIALGATFDTDLIFKLATAISDEARAKYNISKKHGGTKIFHGLTFFSPNINIFRDPRWGRGQETFGEDPCLTAKIGTAFVKGLQGNHKKYLKAAACAKHFAVHSGPEKLRHEFDAKIPEKDLFETYLPAFKALVDAGVAGIMGAYNRLNGMPCCAHPRLLLEIARTKWKFKGYITTDGWAVRDFHTGHGVTKNPVESAALAVNNGCDLIINGLVEDLMAAVREGLLNEQRIDKALYWLFMIRFRLGMFDPPEKDPYKALGENVINCKKHRQLAKQAALKSIVLLKNKDNILPLDKNISSICVVGPNATNTDILLGSYYGVSSRMVTLLEGIAGKVSKNTTIQFYQGSLLNQANPNPVNWVKGFIEGSDVVIAAMGLSPLLEGEFGEAIGAKNFGDRAGIGLPKNQIEFIKDISEVGKPVILLISGGSPVAIPEIHDVVAAIVYIWYPGEEGGNAVADILFGDAVPSGRLPVTVPRSVADLPVFNNYAMRGRTYRYMKKPPLYPFGFGLSYTRFSYSALTISESPVKIGRKVKVTVNVANRGERVAEEVVQLYISKLNAPLEVPLYELKDFKRVTLKPKQEKQVAFTITPAMLEYVDNSGVRILEPGDFLITIGGVSPGSWQKELGAARTVQKKLNVSALKK